MHSLSWPDELLPAGISTFQRQLMLDLGFMTKTIGFVLSAVPMTLLITFVPVVIGSIIGTFLCVIRIKNIPAASRLVGIFYSFFRSCPLVVLIFLSYYGLPKLINILIYGGERRVSVVSMSNIAVALITLTLYSSAFLGEIMRGAINSVERGQFEGAYSLGLSKAGTFRYVILPQALRIAVPNISNFCIGLMKGSSVVFVIGVVDMMAAAKLRAEAGYRYIEAYILVAFLYVALSFLISAFFRYAERHLSRGFMA